MVRPEFPRVIYPRPAVDPERVVQWAGEAGAAAGRRAAAGMQAIMDAARAETERAARTHVEQAWLEAEKSALELLRFELGAAGCALRRAGLHLVAAFGAAVVRARGR